MKTTIEVTSSELAKVPLPAHAPSYAAISYMDIMREVRNQLDQHNLTLRSAVHRATISGDVATGTYFLNYGTDPDIRMMFAWTNSYNKMKAFSCGIGSYVTVCLNGMLSANYGMFRRKHTGDAKIDSINNIQQHFSIAKGVFELMVRDKDLLVNTRLTKKDSDALVGSMFLEEILGSTQLGRLKAEIDSPSYTYSGDSDSAWHLYNHTTHALKTSHPMHAAGNLQKIHALFMDAVGYVPEVIEEQPVQLTLTEPLVYEI